MKSEAIQAAFGNKNIGRPPRHPFSLMEIDEVIEIQGEQIHKNKMQAYCHVYGRTAGMKFSTRTIDGALYVKRVS